MAFFKLQNPWVPFAFLTGGFFSGLAGFFGMKTATFASARTANAAKESNEHLTKKAKEVEMLALRIFGNLNNVKREACKK